MEYKRLSDMDVARRIYKSLGLKLVDSVEDKMCQNIEEICTDYRNDSQFYINELAKDTYSQLNDLIIASKGLRLALTSLGNGARTLLNAQSELNIDHVLWLGAGGNSLPQAFSGSNKSDQGEKPKGPMSWDDSDNPKKGWFVNNGYNPSPIEMKLKWLEELAKIRIEKLGNLQGLGNRKTGDLLERSRRMLGGHLHYSPRDLMIESCLMLFGENKLDLSTKSTTLNTLIRKIHEEVKGEPVKASKSWVKEGTRRAKRWWELVGPYHGVRRNEVPPNLAEIFRDGWKSISRGKKDE